MIESILIKNFGIIEQTTLTLDDHLNILTGETGAGKSILIDALRFALGERFQMSHMRDGADQCLVEVVFQMSKNICAVLKSFEDIDTTENALIIQRSVTRDGKNRIRINGLTSTVGQLKELGDALIDFHGPHDHQMLLAEDRHLNILDALIDFKKDKAAYQEVYHIYQGIQKKIAALQSMVSSRERDLDLLTHQIQELEQVPLQKDAFEKLQSDQIKINNSEKLFSHIQNALELLENEDMGLETLLARSFSPIQSLADIDPKVKDQLNTLSAMQENASDLVASLKDYGESLSFDPDYAKAINDKFDMYHNIFKKYGPTLDDAQTFYAEAKDKHDLLSDFDHNEASLQKELSSVKKDLNVQAQKLTKRRQEGAKFLKTTIEKELKELGFKSILFEARMDKVDFYAEGHDQIVFFISPNVGEGLKPMAEIVSSGESARIMLAIKKALMQVDPVPVLIFDEIDAQIGGRLGTIIGQKLQEISAHRQVILITHLPQIAAFAQRHQKIIKVVENGRTKTVITPLEGKSRLQELAHMMAGDNITDAALKHAQDLLTQVS